MTHHTHDLQVMDALPALQPPPLPAVLDAMPAVVPPPLPAPPKRGIVVRLVVGAYRVIGSVLEWLFGAAVLTVGLAVLAAVPVAQFLSLGYLLESGGRVARSGRLRDAFIGVRLAARLGGVVVGSWLLLLPVRFVSSMAYSANIIDPGGKVARGWRLGLFLLIGFTALHIAAACMRGGKLRYFAWPFNVVWLVRRILRGGYFAEARDAVWDAALSLRLPYYFLLGFRGFVAALAWLVVPITLLAAGHAVPPLGFLGALLLGVVLLWLPFLQMRVAETNRLSAGFELRGVRADFKRAPWVYTAALIVTLAFALPLYLLKIEMVPREAAWLPSLFFIAFIFPARILTGWAVSWARHREAARHWFFRWAGWLPQLPAVAFYVMIVYFTQFTSWNGVFSLYEQHAFLLPVPFFGM